MFSKSKTEETATPTMERLEDHPQCAAEYQKLRELQGKRSDITRELDETRREQSGLRSADNDLDRDAAAMLGGGAIVVTARTDLAAKVAYLAREKEVVDRAIELQRKQIETVESLAKKEIAAAVRPQYVRIVGAMKTAVENLRVAVEAEHEYRLRVRDATAGSGRAGVFSYMMPMELRRVGDDKEPTEFLDRWLEDVAKNYPELCK